MSAGLSQEGSGAGRQEVPGDRTVAARRPAVDPAHAFFAELLDEKPDLLARIVRFNREKCESEPSESPESSVALSQPVADALRRHPELERAFQEHLGFERTKGESELEPEHQVDGFWNFVRPSERLALLPADRLVDLALRAAASLLAEDCARVLDREGVRALRETVGRERLEYALLRGRWLAGDIRRGALAPFFPVPGIAPEAPAGERVRVLGRLLLDALRVDWAPELRRMTEADFARLALPAAPVRVDLILKGPERPAALRALRHFFLKLIDRELDSEWPPLFD